MPGYGLTVGYVTDPSETSYTTADTLYETTSRARKRLTINRTGLGFGLRFTQTTDTADSRLWALDADGWTLEGDRLV